MASDRAPWSPQEDQVLLHLVQKHGQHSWTKVAAQLLEATGTTRTGKQCRERYHNQLDDAVTKRPWTPAEECALFSLQRALGNKWADIARALPGRTDNSVKNQWYSAMRRIKRRLHRGGDVHQGLEGLPDDLRQHLIAQAGGAAPASGAMGAGEEGDADAEEENEGGCGAADAADGEEEHPTRRRLRRRRRRHSEPFEEEEEETSSEEEPVARKRARSMADEPFVPHARIAHPPARALRHQAYGRDAALRRGSGASSVLRTPHRDAPAPVPSYADCDGEQAPSGEPWSTSNLLLTLSASDPSATHHFPFAPHFAPAAPAGSSGLTFIADVAATRMQHQPQQHGLQHPQRSQQVSQPPQPLQPQHREMDALPPPVQHARSFSARRRAKMLDRALLPPHLDLALVSREAGSSTSVLSAHASALPKQQGGSRASSQCLSGSSAAATPPPHTQGVMHRRTASRVVGDEPPAASRDSRDMPPPMLPHPCPPPLPLVPPLPHSSSSAAVSGVGGGGSGGSGFGGLVGAGGSFSALGSGRLLWPHLSAGSYAALPLHGFTAHSPDMLRGSPAHRLSGFSHHSARQPPWDTEFAAASASMFAYDAARDPARLTASSRRSSAGFAATPLRLHAHDARAAFRAPRSASERMCRTDDLSAGGVERASDLDILLDQSPLLSGAVTLPRSTPVLDPALARRGVFFAATTPSRADASEHGAPVTHRHAQQQQRRHPPLCSHHAFVQDGLSGGLVEGASGALPPDSASEFSVAWQRMLRCGQQAQQLQAQHQQQQLQQQQQQQLQQQQLQLQRQHELQQQLHQHHLQQMQLQQHASMLREEEQVQQLLQRGLSLRSPFTHPSFALAAGDHDRYHHAAAPAQYAGVAAPAVVPPFAPAFAAGGPCAHLSAAAPIGALYSAAVAAMAAQPLPLPLPLPLPPRQSRAAAAPAPAQPACAARRRGSKSSVDPDEGAQALQEVFYAFLSPGRDALARPELEALLDQHSPQLLVGTASAPAGYSQLVDSLFCSADAVNLDLFCSHFQVCNRCTKRLRQTLEEEGAAGAADAGPCVVRRMPVEYEAVRVRACEHFQWTWCFGFAETGNPKCRGSNRHQPCPKYLANCTLWKHRLRGDGRKADGGATCISEA